MIKILIAIIKVYYCLYGDDALNAAHDVFKTTTVLKYICGNK